MRFPRGSASTLLTLAAGGIAALAVGLTGLPLVRAAADREEESLSRQLSVAARLSAAQLQELEVSTEDRDRWDEALDRIRAAAELDHAVLMVPGQPTWRASKGVTDPDRLDSLVSGALEACGEGPGVRLTRRVSSVDGQAQIQGACMQVPLVLSETTARLILLNEADYEGYLEEAERRTLVLVMGLGAIVGLVVIAGMRGLLSPIQRVSDAAARISRGERGVRVTPRGPEEIAELARAVNSLAGAFETREDEIAGRLAVVTQLSSIVAHEVRNPLQSLSLLTTLARTEPDPERRNRQLENIETEIRGLEAVVQRFLRNSGPLQIHREPSDLVELLKRATAVAEPQARSKQVTLMIQAPGRLSADLDSSLVRRAVENLLLNAIEFAALKPPGQVTLSVFPRGKQVFIVVDDDGPGVARDKRERVFEPYHSSKSGGTGLGLALVKQVLTAHGGTIICEDSPLGGARFVAQLPISPPEKAPA